MNIFNKLSIELKPNKVKSSESGEFSHQRHIHKGNDQQEEEMKFLATRQSRRRRRPLLNKQFTITHWYILKKEGLPVWVTCQETLTIKYTVLEDLQERSP